MSADIRLSKDFLLSEFTRSSTASALGMCAPEGLHCIDPAPWQLANLRELAGELLQPIRDHLGRLRVTSGLRNSDLSKAVGGSSTSAHDHGWAADVRPLDASPEDIMRFLWISDLKFDQAILYPGRVHLGYRRPSTGEQRRQFLVKTKTGFAPWKGLG